MASVNLPTSIDAQYSDDPSDASVQTHQAHHDSIHKVVNTLDIDAMLQAGDQQALLYYSSTGLWGPGTVTTGGGGTGGTTAAAYGRVLLDDYTGTDDARLTSAMSYAGAQTYPPVITLANRQHSFSSLGRTMYDGLRVQGPPGSGNSERLSQTKMPCRIALSGTGSLFTMSGSTSVYSCYFGNVHVTGGSTATFLGQGTGTGSIRNLFLENFSYVNLKSFLGTYSAKLLVTSLTIIGFVNGNACYDTQIHIGGSGEGNIFGGGGIFDGGTTAYTSAGASVGHPVIWLDGYELASVHGIFITSEADWGGLLITGPAYNSTTGNQGGPINLYGVCIEGRNASTPCYGSVLRIQGGIVVAQGCRFLHGMSNPTAMTGHSPTDAGLVHVTAGEHRFRDCFYDRYTGQAESAPMLYVGGGNVLHSGTLKGAKGGVWTANPGVHAQSPGTVTNSPADGTMTTV